MGVSAAAALMLLAAAGGDGGRVPLGAGSSRTIELAIEPGAAYVLTVDELGIDCDATVSTDSRSLRGFDGDLLRHGHYRFAFVATAADARLTVSASRPGSPDGMIDWRLERVVLADDRSSGTFALDLLETETADRFRDPARAASDETVHFGEQLLQGRVQLGDDAGTVRASQLLDRVLAGVARRPDAIAVLERALPVMQRLGDARAAAGAENNIGMHWFRLGDGRLAEAPLRRALKFAQSASDTLLEAVVQNNLCLTTASRGRADDSVRCYRRALALSTASGDVMRIATAHNNLGNALSAADRHADAAAEFQIAIDLREAIGDAAGSGDPLGNLGLERQAEARYDEAEALFVRAEAVYRAAKNRDGLSTALRHRGQLRLLLGDPAGAAELLSECVTLDRASGRRRDLITALTRLGEAQSLAGAATLPPTLTEAVELARRDAEPRTLADALLRQARAANRTSQSSLAVDSATEAARIAQTIGDARLAGLSHLELARSALHGGKDDTALDLAHAASRELAAASVALGVGEAQGVAGIAEVRLGRLDRGIATLAAATKALESARDSLASPESRARFFAARRDVHEAHVFALLDLAHARADARGIATALEVSDAHRARVLLDRLAPGRAAASTRKAAPWPDDVALLHFLVTPERSVALLKLHGSVRDVALPKGDVLAREVGAFRAAVMAGETDTDLCASLWQPLADLDLPEQIVVVADGPLLGLPWAALPCGTRRPGAPLLGDHEFTGLPSLAVWRSAGPGNRRDRDREGVDTLVIADPVYRADDPRGKSASVAAAPIHAVLRGTDLVRLPGTQAEADLIARLHGPAGLTVLTGFDANRDSVRRQFADVRSTMHFGTHGAAGTTSLGEAGLVLSQFDRDGHAVDGLLRASEIASLHTDADLVVLAACDSAGGVVVPGESALGVSYAFTMAGAHQVIGTLWPVADDATSALMEAFYGAYFRDHLAAPAALRQAQLTLQSSSRFHDARNWAAFQLSRGPGG